MKKTNSQKRLQTFLEADHISSFFSSPDLPFELYQFEKGEFLNNELDPSGYLLFPVSGSIRILHVRDDGSMYQIASGRSLTCLGDMEFASGRISPYLVEAVTVCQCIVLPLKNTRSSLENDPVFLRFLLCQLAEKMDLSTASQAIPRSLKERLDFYIRTQCTDNTLKGVAKAASALGVSRRQLLRILKQMCEEGTMAKTGKGTYTLQAEKK
jgi:CRP-like cAMP-binding protein